MKHILIASVLLAFIGCGKQGTSKIFPLKDSEVQKFVNDKAMPADPNLTIDKSFVNNSYPIQIALYKNGQFYYDLPNLGDGTGTWEKNGGKIELRAKRTLFNMYIEVHGSDETNSSVTIQFSDRFGPNTLKMMNVNIP